MLLQMAVKVFAPAKINLALHVTGQRKDGYHLLDSFVMFADVGDWVSVRDAAGATLTVSGPESKGAPSDARNSVLQAAQFLNQTNLALALEKNLPTAAGIGGGTADAAAAIKAICTLRKQNVPDNVLQLGADVPVCMQGVATRMSGIGEVLTPVKSLPSIACVLVNPRVGVSTPEVFNRLKSKDNDAMPVGMPGFETAQSLAGWLAQQRNDLEAPAINAAPEISRVLNVLSAEKDQLLARMSGSGATCFALFETITQARKAASKISNDHPDWWVQPARLT